ncbi:TMhelix containing protein [Vibrio phage 1.187.O._10N.286.49.F1]|nr:TMhelix containing protein [Vibrio phage 1.187.O._10N.286.49.F1]
MELLIGLGLYILCIIVSCTTWGHFKSEMVEDDECAIIMGALSPLTFPIWIIYKLYKRLLESIF